MLLPAGRLRESASQMKRANVIIFTKCPPAEVTPIMRRILQMEVKLKPYQELFFTTFEYGKIKPVFSGIRLKVIFTKNKFTNCLLLPELPSPGLSRNILINLPPNQN
jgi:tetraacyldisaccharide 4'-kinase